MSVLKGFARELRRLWTPQSAFTMRDLLNVSCSGEPPVQLQQIYEWYFKRTTTAIRSAFTSAGLVAAALYGLIDNKSSPDALLVGGLAFLALACALAGIVQMRQLGQLHSELAAALRLLAEITELSAGWRRRARLSQPSRPRKRTRVYRVLVGVLIAAFAISVAAAIIAAGLCRKTPAAEVALGVVAAMAAIAVSIHVVRELIPHHLQAPRWADVLDRRLSVDDAIGRVRLDDYVLFEEVTPLVVIAISFRSRLVP